ncbi:MAG: 3-dehydroquinate dehydratase [Deltaproteobacteria bacterium]|nr:3-dehydroquinate dehydratase [Deltaproteobacteria bacterium]
MSRIAVVHGPNLNLLGRREPAIYGRQSLDDIHAALEALARDLGHTIAPFQSNHEGALIDHLQACRDQDDAVLLNAGGYTHTSVALRDAVSFVNEEIPVVEVHLSIPEAREAFRHESLLAGVVRGRIEGFGPLSYLLALRAASALIAQRGDDRNE